MANESFLRWQERTLQQMGAVTNALLLMTTATIGFVMNFLLNNRVCCWTQFLLITGLLSLILCVVVLSIQSINRLIDFRKTTQIAKDKDSTDVTDLRAETDIHGKYTWGLLYLGVVLFVIGFITIGLGFFHLIL